MSEERRGGEEKVLGFSSSPRLYIATRFSRFRRRKKNEEGREMTVKQKKLTAGEKEEEYQAMKERYEARKLSLSGKILTVYGFGLIAGLIYINVRSGGTYFHSGNILLLGIIIASYPILGIALTILEVIFGKNGGF